MQPFYQFGYRQLQMHVKFPEHLFQSSLTPKYLMNVKSSLVKMKSWSNL